MCEISSALLEKIQSCQKCPSINGYLKFPSDSHGKLDAKYVLVSEAPGKVSLQDHKKYWMGTGGQLLRSCLAGNLEDLFYITDIVKCWPESNGENRTPSKEEIQNCSTLFDQEIEELKPELIISLGKPISEYLLQRSVSMKAIHGKIFEIDHRSILTLLHPSNIDLHYERNIYTSELKRLLTHLQNEPLNIDTVKSIFTNTGALEDVEEKVEEPPVTKVNLDASFILPAIGNMITQGDIDKGQVRITVDFKNHFPAFTTTVKAEIAKRLYPVTFTHRGSRSHILKLGSDLINKLMLNAGGKIKVSIVDKNTYRLEKL